MWRGLATLGLGVLLCGCMNVEGDLAGECTDAADNDRDGVFDCDDPDCFGSPDCDEPGDDAAGDDDDLGDDDTGDDDTGDDDTGVEDDDTGDDDTSMPVSYAGVVYIEGDSGDWGMQFVCEGEASASMDWSDGFLEGTGMCSGEVEWWDEITADLLFECQLSNDDVTGVMNVHFDEPIDQFLPDVLLEVSGVHRGDYDMFDLEMTGMDDEFYTAMGTMVLTPAGGP